MPYQHRHHDCHTHWNPGLDNGHLTLGYVLATLPGIEANDVPWQVRLLENPESKFAFPGKIDLFRHDALHVLLGRGLTPQDEAFVVGYTMGAARDFKYWHKQIFLFLASSKFYPKEFRFTPKDRISYDLGVNQAIRHGATDLHDFPFEDNLDRTADELRQELKINRLSLQAAYRMEQILIPCSPESRRLDADFGGIDPSTLLKPES